MNKVKCGNANPKGNIALKYKGGCGKELDIKDAYRCVGCGGWFHKDCIIEHFKQEKTHDWGRMEERKEMIELVKKRISDEITYQVKIGSKQASYKISVLYKIIKKLK